MNMMSIPPILVINLDRSKDRRRHMEKELGRFGVEYSFFPAVDGNKLMREERRCYSLGHAVGLKGRPLRDQEIGCALSHVHVYEKMVAENIKELLILEDDCIFEDHFFEVLSCRESWLPSGWSLINFCMNYKFIIDAHRKPLRDLNSSIPPLELVAVKRHKRTACYLINLHGTQQLLDIAYPIRMPADNLTSLTSMSRLNAYTIFPFLAGWADLGTTTQLGSRGSRAKHRELWKQRQLMRWATIRYGVDLKTKSMMEEDHSPGTLKRISRWRIIKSKVKKLLKILTYSPPVGRGF